MDNMPPSNATLRERLADIKLIEAAVIRAVQGALLHHKRAGNPVAVWRNGRVEWLRPQDIPAEELSTTPGKH